MEENEVSTTIAAMAARGGVTTSAFYRRKWQHMTPAERIEEANDWIGDLSASIKAQTLLRDSLIVGRDAMQLGVTK